MQLPIKRKNFIIVRVKIGFCEVGAPGRKTKKRKKERKKEKRKKRGKFANDVTSSACKGTFHLYIVLGTIKHCWILLD